MAMYRVTKTYKYTEVVEVEAENDKDAEVIAQDMEGERIHDDWLYDINATEIKGK